MATGTVSRLEDARAARSSRSVIAAPAIGAIVALMVYLFGAALVDMAHDWWIEPAWSQGMLLPPLALYIAWMGRANTLAYPAILESRGVLITALGCAILLFGRLATEFFLMRISFVIVLFGITWTFWGRRRLRTLAYPFLLLATMVPLPVIVYNSLAAPLQLLASDIATRIAQGLGISVFRDGNIVHLAGITLGIEEACSGLNSLSALVVAALLLGYLICTGTLSRMVLVVLAPALAIAVNIVRVAGTAICADYNQELAMGIYHLFSGWIVFVLGFATLYLLARFLHFALDRN